MAEMPEPQVSSVPSLYELSLSAVVHNAAKPKNVAGLPQNIFFDVCYELYKKKRLCLLEAQFNSLERFGKLLPIKNRRVHLLQMFQALIQHGIKIMSDFVIRYTMWSCITISQADEEQLIEGGLSLGEFLGDAGWYRESAHILLTCYGVCMRITSQRDLRRLRCCHKLLRVQTTYYLLKLAEESYETILKILEQLKKDKQEHNMHSALYTEISFYFSALGEYDKAYRWSVKALKHLNPTLPVSVIIDVLRQAEKACVNKYEFQKGGMLIKQAVCLAREVYGTDHPKYGDVLSDYGFYLVNTDNISNSVTVYEAVLKIRSAIFGKTSLLVALVHLDLAYALYVHRYTSRDFKEAWDHAQIASNIMDELLPQEHVMQSISCRVKGLILEERALLNTGNEESFFSSSLRLQHSALKLVRAEFGERNVQTAKHYTNLGRLYQSMGNYEESEAMQLKAISIKEDLLGADHSEVGLSIGHLASLYTFHMERYREAEKLYHRSMAISLKTYGEAFSGLEYDYRGLLHTYAKLKEYDKCSEYAETLSRWEELKKRQMETQEPPFDFQQSPQSIEDLIKGFFGESHICDSEC